MLHILPGRQQGRQQASAGSTGTRRGQAAPPLNPPLCQLDTYSRVVQPQLAFTFPGSKFRRCCPQRPEGELWTLYMKVVTHERGNSPQSLSICILRVCVCVCVCVCVWRETHIKSNLHWSPGRQQPCSLVYKYPCQLPMKRWRIMAYRQNHLAWIPNSCLERDWATRRDGKIQHCGLRSIKGVFSTCLISPLPQPCSPISTPSPAWDALPHSSLHTHPVSVSPLIFRHSTSSMRSLLNMAVIKYISFALLTCNISLMSCSHAVM